MSESNERSSCVAKLSAHRKDDPDHIAHPEQMMAMGLNQFGALYEETKTCVNDDKILTSTSSSSARTTTIAPIFRRALESVICLRT